MDDWYNDPPEEPEPPVCLNAKNGCEGYGLEIGFVGGYGIIFKCEDCGLQWISPMEEELTDEDVELMDAIRGRQ